MSPFAGCAFLPLVDAFSLPNATCLPRGDVEGAPEIAYFGRPASQNENPLGVLFGSALYGFCFPYPWTSRPRGYRPLSSRFFRLRALHRKRRSSLLVASSNLIHANFFPHPTIRPPTNIGPTNIPCESSRYNVIGKQGAPNITCSMRETSPFWLVPR